MIITWAARLEEQQPDAGATGGSVVSTGERSMRRGDAAPTALEPARLGQVAADSHVAPAPAVVLREIEKEQSAVMAGTDLQPVETSRHEKPPDGPRSGEQ